MCLTYIYIISYLGTQLQFFLIFLFFFLAPYVELEFEILKGFNFNNQQ